MKIKIELEVQLGNNFIDPKDQSERDWLFNEELHEDNLQLYSLENGGYIGRVDRVISCEEVEEWIELEGNETLFAKVSLSNCPVKFDDGTECNYFDKHPYAKLTHFKTGGEEELACLPEFCGVKHELFCTLNGKCIKCS